MVAPSRVVRWAMDSALADEALRQGARNLFRDSGLVRCLPLTGLMLEVEASTGHLVEAVMRRAQWRRCVAANAVQDPAPRLASRLHRRSFLAVRASTGSLPFSDARFDAAWSGFAWHRLPPDAQDRVLAEMHRVTRPGGTLVLIANIPTSADQRLGSGQQGGLHYRTVAQWRAVLPAYGWQIVEEVSFTTAFPRGTLRPVPRHSLICRRG